MGLDVIKAIFARGRSPSAAPTSATTDTSEVPMQPGHLSRMGSGIAKSASNIRQKLSFLAGGRRLDEQLREDIEDALLQADLGPELSARIVAKLADQKSSGTLDLDEALNAIAREISVILRPLARPLPSKKPDKGPHVILVVGVNGSGKTTTIGKIAAQLTSKCRKVMLASGDTFRAAADEQLRIWAERTGSGFLSSEGLKDTPSVAFAGYEEAIRGGFDTLIVDTAGRLQNNADLMAELEKTARVLTKCTSGAAYTVLVVLDATVGQNSIRQVEEFRKRVPITGIVMTKLDGTARGGILVSLASKFGLPVHFIGVGEGADDFLEFDPVDFSISLVGSARNMVI